MASNLEESPTTTIYRELQEAYDYFNRTLFDGRLPDCLIVLSYHRTAYGYFRSKPFISRDQLEAYDAWADAMQEGPEESAALLASRPGIDEISLNIFYFRDRSREDILSTLVHEMVHLEQHHFGEKVPKRPVHNKEWGEMMKAVGLYPSATGAPGGKETGRKVSHYVVEGGEFDEVVDDCPVKLDWVGMLPKKKSKDRKRKVTYACEPCEVKVRGNEDLHIVCGECGERMEVPE